ncbi:MAG TPA: hypothetical protein VLM37_11260, partial [Fibrobacteraceae bacterium]|nr:hypothetical protein [Fibrobacteraceae bacterium]
MSVTYFYSPFRACVVLSLISLAGVILGCSSGTDSVVDGISINEDACASGDGLDSLVGMEFQNGTLVIAYRCVDSSLELWRADTSLSSYEGLWISAMSGDYVLSRTENGVFGVATGVDVLTSNHELNLPFNARLVTADIMNDTVLVADSSGKLYRLSLGGRIIDSLSTGGHVTQVGVSVDRSSPLVLVDGGVSMVDFTSRTVTPLSQSIGEVDDQAFVLHGDTLTVLGNSLYQLIGDDVSKDSLDI